MKWEGQEQSSNVEDRRGAGGGGGGMMPRIGGRGIGLGTIVIALIAGWIFGINPLTLMGIFGGGGGLGGAIEAPVVQAPAQAPPANDRAAAFVSTVLRDTEVVWTKLFQEAGATYREPVLVLYRGVTRSGCGVGQAAMGPFYCPADGKVYIDLGFFDTLAHRMGAPGDFAQAYVIAHEIGHHVQNLIGISAKVDAQRGRLSEAQSNALSVLVELQADCLAGVWAHHSQKGKGWLEQGDDQEAINAAGQIGDDTLQRRSQGTVVPESFTHGTSAQRITWFRHGRLHGAIPKCNTFTAERL